MSDSSSNSDSASFGNSDQSTFDLKPEFKEYRFEPTSDQKSEQKINSFWEFLDSVLPAFQKLKCSESDQNESIGAEENERKVPVENKRIWTRTMCMMHKRGLDKLAMASNQKSCTLCNNTKFTPLYSDEDCKDLIYEIIEKESNKQLELKIE